MELARKGSTAAAGVLGALAVVVVAISVRLAGTGLFVGRDGLRIRRFWSTTTSPWADIECVEVIGVTDHFMHRSGAGRILAVRLRDERRVWVPWTRVPDAESPVASRLSPIDDAMRVGIDAVAERLNALLAGRR